MTMNRSLEAIHIAPRKGGPVTFLRNAVAIAGHGLQDDRYGAPGKPKTGQHVTLDESNRKKHGLGDLPTPELMSHRKVQGQRARARSELGEHEFCCLDNESAPQGVPGRHYDQATSILSEQ